jgi:hypothetical protein
VLVTDAFRANFDDEDLIEIDKESAIVYGLNRDLEIVLLNAAWERFATENNAPNDFFERYSLGASYLDCLPEPLRDFFEKYISKSMETEEVWTFDYLCPSPSMQRKFHMQVLPLPERGGCLISNGLIVEAPHPDERGADLDLLDCYIAGGELLTVCSHCRRTRHDTERDRWDWIPQFLENPPVPVSHSICPTCFAYFYPAAPRT